MNCKTMAKKNAVGMNCNMYGKKPSVNCIAKKRAVSMNCKTMAMKNTVGMNCNMYGKKRSMLLT